MIPLFLNAACLLSLVIWSLLVFFPSRWKMSERWDPSDDSDISCTPLPFLSVIIPARNESKSLPVTLPSWLQQNYPHAEIILIDDASDDGTAACAQTIASQTNSSVKIVHGTPKPESWTGKLWALEQGVRIASGDWFLFTDADIYHNQNVWKHLVYTALKDKRDMISLMALLDTKGRWSQLLIPAFIYFFHLLYPFPKVRNTRSRTAAAAGGCILVSRRSLEKISGLAGHSNAWIDDIALAKRLKKAGFSISLSLTQSVVSIRPYVFLRDIWDMVSRNAFTQLNCSWFALAGTFIGMSMLFLAPVAGVCTLLHNPVTFGISLISLILMATTYYPTLRFYKLRSWRTLTLPIAGALYMAMTITSAINHMKGNRQWRGAR